MSQLGVIDANDVAATAPDAVVFALANLVSEIDPAEAIRFATVVATGDPTSPTRSTMCSHFPAARGLLDAQSSDITPAMLLAAAQELASVVTDDELNLLHHAQRVPSRRAQGRLPRCEPPRGSCPFARRDANDRPGRESSR